MTAQSLRNKFLEFFAARNHKIIPSASLVPPTEVELAGTQKVLFTTAGMHPLIPYLQGLAHPEGKRLVNYQKCLRTDDIDQVGDSWHNTFFEMLGNWSLGDYWKTEAITWSFEFLVNVLKVPKDRIYVTVFGGDRQISVVGADYESIAIWKKLGVDENKIFKLGKKDNWWGPVGAQGPCGPDTEVYVDIGGKPHGANCYPGDNCGRFVEVWNDVFMEFNKTEDGKYQPLAQKNVDTGMGLERTLAVLQGKDNVYDVDVFAPIITEVKRLSPNFNLIGARIIADHLKASVFLIADGILPSNTDRGYILRRLIRRAVRYGKQLGIKPTFSPQIAKVVIKMFGKIYSELNENYSNILEQLELEETNFERVLQLGSQKAAKVFSQKVPIEAKKYAKIMQTFGKKEIFRQFFRDLKLGKTSTALSKFGVIITPDEVLKATISGKEAFDLYQTHGFPIEAILDLAQEARLFCDIEDFEAEQEKHRQLSQAGALGKFSGGLANVSPKTIAGHTATHLLHAALRDVLGDHVVQTGSNISAERIRFDFSHNKKLTEEELGKVEKIINDKIRQGLNVRREIMEIEKARQIGAIGLFGQKYGKTVSVYFIGDYSKEFCGGPHVKNTKELGCFKIIKEESLGAGRRRIYARLEN